MSKKNKKKNNFTLIFKYLKNDKLKVFAYLLLVILTYLPQLLTAFFWGFAIEGLINDNLNQFLLFVALKQVSSIFFYSFLSIPRELLYNYLDVKFNRNVIKDLYVKIQNLPAIAFEEIGVGEFINRMSTDPDRVMDLLSKLIRMICKASVVIMILILAFSVSVILGIEIIVFAIVMGLISYYFFPKIKKTQEKIKKFSDLQVKNATENLTGIREIKALGIKENIKNRLFLNLDELFDNHRKIRKYEVMYASLTNFSYFLLQTMILITCGILVSEGKLSYSLFVVIESYVWRIDQIVESISDFGISYSKIKVSLDRMDKILNNDLYDDEKFGDKELKNPKGVVEFHDVKFKYRDDEDLTLRDLTLTMEPHKKIAIVGKSGNGKSTIFNLLLRYFDANSGTITIDGINIKKLTEESLRNNISIIRQDPFIFNMTILDNFRIVKEDVSLEEVREVCKKAYIDDYIMSLPKQYETVIGEGGVNLSGGQKQRLAIARTLLINTKIILFDEATSSLDNESQKYIKDTINDLVKDHTVIIVAHRLSTIVDSDIINVIDKGTLEASGSHKELLEKSKVYKELYTTDITIE